MKMVLEISRAKVSADIDTISGGEYQIFDNKRYRFYEQSTVNSI